jgi:hypothetical protein
MAPDGSSRTVPNPVGASSRLSATAIRASGRLPGGGSHIDEQVRVGVARVIWQMDFEEYIDK